jgi:hypothetical protein
VETDGRRHDRKIAHEPMLRGVMKRKTDKPVKKRGTCSLHYPDGTETSKDGGEYYEEQ